VHGSGGIDGVIEIYVPGGVTPGAGRSVRGARGSGSRGVAARGQVGTLGRACWYLMSRASHRSQKFRAGSSQGDLRVGREARTAAGLGRQVVLGTRGRQVALGTRGARSRGHAGRS